MKHFGVKFHKAHCSGHVSRKELIGVIKTINPKVLIPIHTERANDFKEFHGNVKIPEKEKMMKI